ncbi:MAG: nitronate monooxygenase [Paracoccaceae bacterium]|nr:nitronate monooxygenase [Paracoccaceae bacterium]
MWPQNKLTERLDIQWPIFQAPMASVSTSALAAAVSNAGGVGGLGMWGLTGEEAERLVAEFQQMSEACLNVNYPLWKDPDEVSGHKLGMYKKLQTLYDEKGLGNLKIPTSSGGKIDDNHLGMIQKLKPEVVSFHFGLPDKEILSEIKAHGIFVVSSATTVKEAKILVSQGADAIIAQGTEAGGHRGTFSKANISIQAGLMSLLPQIVDNVTVPVIAAGGLADGRGVAAAFMLGASAVQIGTGFLSSEEANVHPEHSRALADATDESTVVTEIVTGKPARFIQNRLITELEQDNEDPLPFPAQSILTTPLTETGDRDFMGLYAGQSAALNGPLPASELVAKLCCEAENCFKLFSPNR